MKTICIIYHDLSLGGIQKKILDIARYINRTTRVQLILILRRKKEFDKSFLLPNERVKVYYFSDSFFHFIPLFFPVYCCFLAVFYRAASILAFSFIPGICATFIKRLVRHITVVIGEDFSSADDIALEMASFPQWVQTVLLRYWYSYADWYCVVAKHIQKTLVMKYHIPKKKVTLVKNWFDPTLQGKKQSEQKYDFVYIGRLAPIKNVMEFIYFMQDFLQKYPHVQVAIVGDGAEYEKIQTYIRVHNMIHVHLLGFLKNPNTVLRQSSVLVLPSQSEGQPLVVLDAYAVGVPVLCNAFPSVYEIVDNGKTGFVYRNKEEFLKYAGQLLMHKDVYYRMSKTVVRYARSTYASSNIDWYTRLLYV